eukprot:691822-Amphidinium_carterae.1
MQTPLACSPLVRPDLSLLREAQDSLVRLGGPAGRGLSLLCEVLRSSKKPLLEHEHHAEFPLFPDPP